MESQDQPHEMPVKMAFALVDCTTGRSFLAFENATNIDADFAIPARNVRSVAHQATGLGIFTKGIDRGYCMSRGQCGDLHPAIGE